MEDGDSFKSDIKAAMELLKWRNSQPYDGVLGQLPKWVPDERKDEFCRIRNKLLDKEIYGQKGSVKEIIQWIISFYKLKNSRESTAFYRGGNIPPEVWSDVSYLALIHEAISLGEEKGLPLLADKKAIKGKKFSSGGAPKKGKEFEPKASIRKICEEINSTKFEDVLKSLRNADRCLDWYESTNKPTGVLFMGVYDNKEVISYLLRGALPDNQKQLSFKRLRGILTEIKK